ncbi:DNA polymerase III subunit gamma/tau C-terminal domain-containing protein, partial [Halomonas maura]|uniref:DNA polymerase III subunit gamma/tau C-terminal domain-containing protein n=1 Tax=Halomonas maura TaxID=117606 RepID=UPI0025B5F093
ADPPSQVDAPAAETPVDATPAVEAPVAEPSTPASPPETPAATPSREPALAGEAGTGELTHGAWLHGFEALGLSGLTRNLAAHCVVEADDGSLLTLRLDPSQAAMQAEVHVERIREALAAAGVERRLTIVDGPLPEDIETPRQRAERLAAERHAQAVEALRADPQVQKLQQTFGARLIEASVKPADAPARP